MINQFMCTICLMKDTVGEKNQETLFYYARGVMQMRME